MVLDERALEAMLARQRASEAGHVKLPSVRTEQTPEFEVYERKAGDEAPAPAPEAPAAPRVGPRTAADPRPTKPANVSRSPNAPGPGLPGDFEELPGREVPTQFTPPPAFHPEPEAQPPAHLPVVQPPAPAVAAHPEPLEAAPPAPAPAAQAIPAPPMPATEPVAPKADEAPRRRPQVWPPIRAKEAAPPAASEATASAAPAAPAPASAAPAPAAHVPEPAPPAAPAAPEPQGMPEHTAAAEPAPRTHAPTPHAFAPMVADGSGCRLAIVQAQFNAEITDAMTAVAVAHAEKAGATVSHRLSVPGVYDLPLMVQHMARRRDVDAVVVIGCVVSGETKHDELITFSTAKTLQEISLATDTPIGLGIIGPGMTWAQAEARVGNGAHAVEAALVQWRALQTV